MKKTLAFLLAIMITALALFGCQPTQDPSSDTTAAIAESETTPVIPDHQTIKIMTNDTTKDYIETLVKHFTSKYKDITVDIAYVEGVQSLDYTEKLANDLLAGNGPDVILLSNTNLSNQDVSMAKTDVFADLDALNDIYGYLNWNDYVDTVMEAGVFEGTRKIMPAYYQFPMMLGITEVLDREQIVYGEGKTTADFFNSMNGKEMLPFKWPYYFFEYYRYTGLTLVDQYHATVNLQNDDFRSVVSAYYPVYGEVHNRKYRDFLTQGTYQDSLTGPLLAEEILFINGDYSHPYSCYISFLDGLYETVQNAGKNPEFVAIPDQVGKGIAGTLGYSFAINSATECPEAALRFLAYAVSFEFYCADDEVRAIPVNKAYNAAVRAMYYGEEINLPEGITMRDFAFGISTIDREDLDTYYSYLDQVYIPQYIDQTALNYLSLVVVNMVRNGMSMEESIRQSENELNIFLNE